MNIDFMTLWILFIVGIILLTSTLPYLHKQAIACYLHNSTNNILLFAKSILIALVLVLFITLLAGLLLALMSAQLIKPKYQSVFKTPISRVLITSLGTGHGRVSFDVFSPFEKLVLQDNRNFRNIDPVKEMLGEKRQSWMTHCYFQPANIYYSELPADTWVCTNDDLSRAWVGGKSYFPSEDRKNAESEFAKVFRTPFKDVYGGSIQRQDNKIFYEVSSIPQPGGPNGAFKPGEPLQHVPVKSADAKSCPVKLPPHVYTEWVSKCYYYSIPASDSAKKRNFGFLRMTTFHKLL